MDDRIVDFNELKNKAREKDIDKFEQYIYGLYYSLAQGEINYGDFASKIKKYMEENNVSEQKLFNIQKEIMKRYGFSMEDFENQMKTMGMNIPGLNMNIPGANLTENYESLRKNLSFQEKYKERLEVKNVTTYYIKNKENDLEIILQEDKVIVKSGGRVNLKDNELNEFLCSYKKVRENKPLKVSIYENANSYEY